MPVLECVLLGAMALSFACLSLVGGMLFGVSGLLLLLFKCCWPITCCHATGPCCSECCWSLMEFQGFRV